MGKKREETTHDLKHTTSSMEHSGYSDIAWQCMAAKGTGSLYLLMTADKKQQDQVFRGIRLLTLLKSMTVQMADDPKTDPKLG